MNPYDVLGVPRDATQEQVREAYRRRARETHPDRNPGINSAEFAAVADAWEVLGDAERRAHYDRTGSSRPQREDDERTLRQLFAAALERGSSDNYIGAVSRQLAEAKAQLAARIAAAESMRARLQRALSRVQFTGAGGGNLFEIVTGEKIAALDQDIRNAQATLEQVDRLTQILADYRDVGPGSPATFDVGLTTVWLTNNGNHL